MNEVFGLMFIIDWWLMFNYILGEGFKRNTMLVFSRSEQHQLSTLTDRLKEFLASEISLPFLDFCQGGIHFSGNNH